jgi:N-acetylmuramoyl-L-alanine amidase
VRAVIHVGKIDHYKIFGLSNPPRIVIDVIVGDYRHTGKNAVRKPFGSKYTKKSKSLSLAQQLGLGVGTIVIDAGHGGKDPGALSPGGGQEKTVVLDIAKRLRTILQKRLKFKVITTRDTDRFIPLEERTGIANTKKADLFISIHANASHNRKARGVSTYFLNLSTDKQAMELASDAGARRVVPLAVSIAAHSPLMAHAQEGFNQAVDAAPISNSAIPVIGNVSAQPLTDAAQIRADLRAQLRSRVRWTESIQYLLAQGVETFIEIGNGEVLLGLVKRINRKTRRLPFGKPEDVEGIAV